MAIGSCSTDIAWWSLEKNIPCKIFKNISPLSVQRNLLPAVLFALPIPSWLRIVDMKPNSKSSSQVVELTPQRSFEKFAEDKREWRTNRDGRVDAGHIFPPQQLRSDKCCQFAVWGQASWGELHKRYRALCAPSQLDAGHFPSCRARWNNPLLVDRLSLKWQNSFWWPGHSAT